MKKLSLSALSKKEFDKRELGQILGGENCCLCSCSSQSTPEDRYPMVTAGNSLYQKNDDSGMGYGSGSFK